MGLYFNTNTMGNAGTSQVHNIVAGGEEVLHRGLALRDPMRDRLARLSLGLSATPLGRAKRRPKAESQDLAICQFLSERLGEPAGISAGIKQPDGCNPAPARWFSCHLPAVGAPTMGRLAQGK